VHGEGLKQLSGDDFNEDYFPLPLLTEEGDVDLLAVSWTARPLLTKEGDWERLADEVS
jgi:hypothetical protein